MRSPMSTPRGLKATKTTVQGGVIGHFIGPATPQDSHPGATEDADRVGMIGAALSGSAVDVFGPGMPLAGGVGQRDWALPRVGSQGSLCGVALPDVSDSSRPRADREEPSRCLIDWCSTAPRPIGASGASHRREALVSRGPSVRLEARALSRRRSAPSLLLTSSQDRASLRSAMTYRTSNNGREDYQ